MTIPWPLEPAALLLWAHALLAWTVAGYYVVPDPVGRGGWTQAAIKAVALFALAWGLAAPHRAGAVLGLVLFAAAMLDPAVRALLGMTGRRLEAEWEIALTIAVVGATYLIAATPAARLAWAPIRLPLDDSNIAAALLVAAAALYAGPGGTRIVRGVLQRVQVVPGDSGEYNRGRVIGNLERLLLLAVVAMGQFEALGLILAAKGVVRFDEMKKSRDFAEYFLVGTLTSVAVSLVLGLLLRAAVRSLWH